MIALCLAATLPVQASADQPSPDTPPHQSAATHVAIEHLPEHIIPSVRTRSVTIGKDAHIRDANARMFEARVASRGFSPTSILFWNAVYEELPADLERLAGVLRVQGDMLLHGLRHGRGWLALLGIVAAWLSVFPVRRVLRHLGQRLMIDHAPASRLRRSGLALWTTVLGSLVSVFAGSAVVAGLRADVMIAPAWEPIATAIPAGAFVCGLVIALSSALLQARSASWRMLALTDETAVRMQPWAAAVAALAGTSILLAALAHAAGVGLPFIQTGTAVTVLVHVGLTISFLLTVGRLRLTMIDGIAKNAADEQVQTGVALVTLLPWATAAVTLGALAFGYLQLALMLARLTLWIPVVAAALYLLMAVADDLFSELFARDGTLSDIFHDAFGVRRSVTDQIGVTLSALVRVVLVLAAVGTAFAPFGANIDRPLEQIRELSHGLTLGAITIAPIEVVRAIAVLAGALLMLRIGRHWLTKRFLPATDLDAGAQHSIVTIAGYVGTTVAVLWALAALGIGFQRIALIISALSVGIGFGLQAITQNVISGLIMLVERPLKIGDLIEVGDQEGDVIRISVRATEIELADRSTLIVPNSELITKTVRNMTRSGPLGRLNIPLAVPLDNDIESVRRTMLALLNESVEILDRPTPTVSIESLASGQVHFRAVGHVSSPRDIYAVRSAILADLVANLKSAGVRFAELDNVRSRDS